MKCSMLKQILQVICYENDLSSGDMHSKCQKLNLEGVLGKFSRLKMVLGPNYFENPWHIVYILLKYISLRSLEVKLMTLLSY